MMAYITAQISANLTAAPLQRVCMNMSETRKHLVFNKIVKNSASTYGLRSQRIRHDSGLSLKNIFSALLLYYEATVHRQCFNIPPTNAC